MVVADNGIGIPEAERERIFNKFEQSTRSGAGGTGLGLAICRELVERQGGHISAESNPGGGCRSAYTLPVEAPAPASPESDRAA